MRSEDTWAVKYPAPLSARQNQLVRQISALEAQGELSSEQAAAFREKITQLQKSRALFRTAVEDLALWETMQVRMDLDYIASYIEQASHNTKQAGLPNGSTPERALRKSLEDPEYSHLAQSHSQPMEAPRNKSEPPNMVP